jgi:nitric oxide reductase NorQ protein
MTTPVQHIECLPPESYLVRPEAVAYYHDHGGMLGLFERISFQVPLIMVGPKGVGKSLSVFAFAARERIPLITYSCSEDTRASNLVGSLTLRADETPFICGPLTAAIETANKHGRAILLLEEINALSPQTQKMLNGVADFRKRVEAPAAGRVFELAPGAQLGVMGTMNFSAYGGVNSLNEDLKSRFSMLPLGYPATDDERTLVTGELESAKVHVAPDTVARMLRLAVETRTSQFEYALSPRDVVLALRMVAATDLQTALWSLMGKFEDTDVALAIARITSIFGSASLALYTRQVMTAKAKV